MDCEKRVDIYDIETEVWSTLLNKYSKPVASSILNLPVFDITEEGDLVPKKDEVVQINAGKFESSNLFSLSHKELLKEWETAFRAHFATLVEETAQQGKQLIVYGKIDRDDCAQCVDDLLRQRRVCV